MPSPNDYPMYRSPDQIRFAEWLAAQGWTFYGTGGGCVAWTKEAPATMHFLLTDDEGMDVPRDVLAPCMVGLYDDDGLSLDPNETPHTFATVAEAIRYVHTAMGSFARVADQPADVFRQLLPLLTPIHRPEPHTTVTHNADGSTTYRNPEPTNAVPERNDVPSHDCA
jgi:hypothetical protein